MRDLDVFNIALISASVKPLFSLRLISLLCQRACGNLHNQPATQNRLRKRKAINRAICWEVVVYSNLPTTTTNKKNKDPKLTKNR